MLEWFKFYNFDYRYSWFIHNITSHEKHAPYNLNIIDQE